MNPRIIGALVFGVGLVSLSVYGSLSDQLQAATQTSSIVTVAPERQYIEIEDRDNNGIPDWRESLREARTIEFQTPTTTATYIPPDTLTGQLAIELFENAVQQEVYGEFAASNEEILSRTELQILEAAQDSFYDFADIIETNTTSEEALRAYGVAIADIALQYAIDASLENEAVITKAAIDANNPELLADLAIIAESYRGMREAMLNLPVPEVLAVDHLNLINSYHALYIDVTAMQQAFSDPLLTMTRLKRYEDDALGVYNALRTIYSNLAESGIVYSANDQPVSVFWFIFS